MSEESAMVRDGRARTAEARVPIWLLRSSEWADLCNARPLAAYVLLVLWSFARKDRAWCSTRRLAELTGATRKNVILALRHLEATGWVDRSERRKDGERLADQYELLLPGAVRACADQVNRALGKKGGAAIEHALYQEGDLFAYNGGLHAREARVPQPVIGSQEFRALCRRPATLRVYLLLVAYSSVREFVSARRMAAEAHIDREATVREAYRWLSGQGWLRVEHRKRDDDDAVPTLANGFLLTDPPTLEPNRSADARTEPERPAAAPSSAPCPHCGHAAPSSSPGGDDGKAPSGVDVDAAMARLSADAREFVATAGVQLVAEGSGEPLVLRTASRYVAEHLRVTFGADFDRAFGRAVRILGDDEHAPAAASSSGASVPPERTGEELVRQFHEAVRHVPAALVTPTRKELAYAASLAQEYGRAVAFDIVRYAIKEMRRTRFDRTAGSFFAIRQYVAEAASIYAGDS